MNARAGGETAEKQNVNTNQLTQHAQPEQSQQEQDVKTGQGMHERLRTLEDKAQKQPRPTHSPLCRKGRRGRRSESKT